MRERTPQQAASLHADYYKALVERGIHSLEAIELTKTYILATIMQQLPPNEPWRG